MAPRLTQAKTHCVQLLTVRAFCAFKGAPMLDLVMLAIGLAFFALTVGYAYACDRL
jgi:hypothetical protein